MSGEQTPGTPPAEARKCAGDGSARSAISWRHAPPDAALIRCAMCGHQRYDTNRGYWGVPVCEDCFQAEVGKGVPVWYGETNEMLYPELRHTVKPNNRSSVPTTAAGGG